MRSRFSLPQIAFYLSCGSAVAILFSIAVSQILLALALATLLLSGEKMRFPPIFWPLAAFAIGTVASMLLSVDPGSGKPQVRKFLLYFGVPLVMYSTIRTLPRIKGVILAATAAMSLSALWSFLQFAQKLRAAHALGKNWYEYYTAERITGFVSHWMTLGGQEMVVLLLAGSLVFFGTGRKWKPWVIAGLALILASLVVGFTRSIWLGTFLGGIYLLWLWKRWWVAAVPVVLLLLVAANPFSVRDRVVSSFHPHGDTDSNLFRYVCRRTGWEMIKAHPWFGVGPEQVKAQMMQWIPPDIPRPLPTGWYGHLHNIYIHFAAERGIPTALALMWLLAKIIWDFARAVRRRGITDDARAVLHGGIAMMIGILAVGFYEVNLGDSEVLTLFLILVSFGYVAAGEKQETAT